MSPTERMPAQDWLDDPERRRLATGWLTLGVIALALAGVFALLLVAARAPGTGAFFPTQDFFRVALVVHVDQSVLIWFLAFASVLWSLASRPNAPIAWGAIGIAAAGCLLLAAAPFLGATDPHLSNYVPVLGHPLFVWALAIFAIGCLIQLVTYLIRAEPRWPDPIAIGTFTVAISALMAGVSLAWTWAGISTHWEGTAFYEHLFWGPGHVLQFAYTQVLLVAWIWMARGLGLPLPLRDRALSIILILGILPLLAVPVIHGLYPPDSADAKLAFMRLMQWGNGVAVIPVSVALLVALVRACGNWTPGGDPAAVPIRRALIASIALFGAGGVLAMMISGSNTGVPAHYHGSIVGVTLALMGLTYYLLPRLGLGRPLGRAARLQPWVYGVGQILHIGGLAASGAMGIARKTAGSAQGLDSLAATLSMGVMGLGGLLAVIGGILFVLVVIGAMTRRTPLEGKTQADHEPIKATAGPR